MIAFSKQDNSLTLELRIVPRASKTEIVGELDGAVKVRVSSPPVDGAANAELIKLFARTLGVSKDAVEIVSGRSSRTKRIRIAGVTAEQFRVAIG